MIKLVIILGQVRLGSCRVKKEIRVSAPLQGLKVGFLGFTFMNVVILVKIKNMNKYKPIIMKYIS